MSLSPIPRSVEDEEESVMGGLGLIFLLEAAEGGARIMRIMGSSDLFSN